MLVDLSVAVRARLSVWSPYHSPREAHRRWCASSQCACEIGKGFLILDFGKSSEAERLLPVCPAGQVGLPGPPWIPVLA